MFYLKCRRCQKTSETEVAFPFEVEKLCDNCKRLAIHDRMIEIENGRLVYAKGCADWNFACGLNL